MDQRKLTLAAAGVAIALSGCFFDVADPTTDPATHTLNDRGVHDPSVIRDEAIALENVQQLYAGH
jgi:hypothetical protein